MNTCELTFVVQSTGPGLHLTVKIDDTIVYDGFPGENPEKISYSFDDSVESDHSLSFEMSGKLPEHTTVSEAGTILRDRVIKISEISFDGIVLGPIFTDQNQYHHDFNGTQPATVGKFYGDMGCNGTVVLKFRTPIYLWLLENM